MQTLTSYAHRDRTGQHFLYLKIDSGASANTITVRTAKQIYGDK